MSRTATIALAAICAGLLAAGASTLSLSAQTTAPPGDAAHGKLVFNQDGCYLCHNYQGQGTGSRAPGQNPGPNLAPGPITYDAFVKQLRTPRAEMPPYDASILSDKDMADIYAFLASQPPTKDARSIALLAAVDTGKAVAAAGVSPVAAHGHDVFAANCAACHGAAGEGGVGPALKGESARKDAAGVAAFVKNPVAPMPKLFPGVLSENDVTAVAAYVETLH